jgi:hypothetical protein
MTKLAITVEIILSRSKAGNIPAETEAIESFADTKTVSETVTVTVKRVWTLRILKELKCYIF